MFKHFKKFQPRCCQNTVSFKSNKQYIIEEKQRKRYQNSCSNTVANGNPITAHRYKQYIETPMIPSTKVTQCNIYHEDINTDLQNDNIINPNVNDFVNCAKENIKNSIDLHSSNNRRFQRDII